MLPTVDHCLPLYATSSSTDDAVFPQTGFGIADHERLAGTYMNLKSRGVTVILSNSYSDKVLSLYPNEVIHVLSGSRNIGGNPDSRKNVKEVIIHT